MPGAHFFQGGDLFRLNPLAAAILIIEVPHFFQ